eukprot:263247_1
MSDHVNSNSVTWIKVKQTWSNNRILRYFTYVTASLLLNRIYNVLHRKINNYPPGEYGMPFIGSAYSLLLFKGVARWYIYISNTFGPVSMLYFGRTPLVFINDLAVLQESFKDKRLLWRGHKLEGNGDASIGRTGSLENTNGELWRFRRQMTHKAFSLLSNSTYIRDRIHKLVTEIMYVEMDKYAKKHKDYYSQLDLKYSMFVFLFVAMFGDTLKVPEKYDEDFKQLIVLIDEVFKDIQNKKIIDFFCGKDNFVANFMRKQMRINEPRNNTFLLIKSWVEKYKLSIKKSEDCYIKRMMECITDNQDQSMNNVNSLSWNNLFSDTTTLFMTAMHITLGQMESALYFAAKYEKQQELVYNELSIYYQEHDKLDPKYVKDLNIFRAFIYEVMRTNGLIKQTLPRKIICNDLKINGYNIPYGATVMGNSTAIMASPQYWKNPNQFDLCHFIDQETNKFVKPAAFLTFGIGKRSCVGENFALQELYAVLAPLLYRYRFSIPISNAWNIEKNQWATSSVKQLPLSIQLR